MKRRMLRYCWEILVMSGFAIFFELVLVPGSTAEAARRRCLVSAFVLWRAVCILRFETQLKYSDYATFSRFVQSHLYSGNVWKQSRATGVLGLLLGNRFGWNYWLSKRFSREVECWRTWWESNRDRLRWDPFLGVYTEVSDTPKGAAPTLPRSSNSHTKDAKPTIDAEFGDLG